jgi:hypothetical protein
VQAPQSESSTPEPWTLVLLGAGGLTEVRNHIGVLSWSGVQAPQSESSTPEPWTLVLLGAGGLTDVRNRIGVLSWSDGQAPQSEVSTPEVGDAGAVGGRRAHRRAEPHRRTELVRRAGAVLGGVHAGTGDAGAAGGRNGRPVAAPAPRIDGSRIFLRARLIFQKTFGERTGQRLRSLPFAIG